MAAAEEEAVTAALCISAILQSIFYSVILQSLCSLLPSSFYFSPYETHRRFAISRRANVTDGEKSPHLIANYGHCACTKPATVSRCVASWCAEGRPHWPTVVSVWRQADCGCDGTCAPVAGTRRAVGRGHVASTGRRLPDRVAHRRINVVSAACVLSTQHVAPSQLTFACADSSHAICDVISRTTLVAYCLAADWHGWSPSAAKGSAPGYTRCLDLSCKPEHTTQVSSDVTATSQLGCGLIIRLVADQRVWSTMPSRAWKHLLLAVTCTSPYVETPRACDNTRQHDMSRTPATGGGGRGGGGGTLTISLLVMIVASSIVGPVSSSFPKRIPIGNVTLLLCLDK